MDKKVEIWTTFLFSIWKVVLEKKKQSRKQNSTLMDSVEMNALFVLLTLT